MRRPVGLFMAVIFENRITYGDAFVADVRTGVIAWGRNQLADNILAFMAKGTAERIVRTSTLHADSPELGSGLFDPELSIWMFLL